jgi:hypothetical protein
MWGRGGRTKPEEEDEQEERKKEVVFLHFLHRNGEQWMSREREELFLLMDPGWCLHTCISS